MNSQKILDKTLLTLLFMPKNQALNGLPIERQQLPSVGFSRTQNSLHRFLQQKNKHANSLKPLKFHGLKQFCLKMENATLQRGNRQTLKTQLWSAETLQQRMLRPTRNNIWCLINMYNRSAFNISLFPTPSCHTSIRCPIHRTITIPNNVENIDGGRAYHDGYMCMF